MEYIEQITNYLKKNLKKGYTLDSLKWTLVEQGYSRSAIEKAIKKLNADLAKTAPPLKEKPIIKYEILDDKDQPIKFKKSFWERFFK